jgi:D-glycero-D-manno-heptose 1,7-bisphosphate phosphatase
MVTKKPAIFLDRDGVVNELIDRGDACFVQGKKVRFTAPWRFQEFKLREGAAQAITQLRQSGYLVILVTNQPDIAYGTMTEAEHEKIMAIVKELPWDGIFVCTHGRNDGCDCKKPKPGMLLAAARKHHIDLMKSFMVGDSVDDVRAGRAAGCRTVLILDDHSRSEAADIRVPDLRSFVEKIIIHT